MSVRICFSCPDNIPPTRSFIINRSVLREFNQHQVISCRDDKMSLTIALVEREKNGKYLNEETASERNRRYRVHHLDALLLIRFKGNSLNCKFIV